MKLPYLSVKIDIIIVFLLCWSAFAALFVPGFYGASDDIHIAWLHQMDQVVRMGQIPPRFVPDLSFGFGYPLFNFVFPLPFYIGEIIHLIGLSFVDAIKSVFFLTIVLSSFSMYFLLRSFSGRLVSITGAILYVYTPYRAVDVYLRGAIGESVAFIFFPLIILSITKLTSDENRLKSWKWIGIGGLSLIGLILSHNIATYMFMPFALIWGIMRVIAVEPKITAIKRLIFSLFLGLGGSIYFWLPALVDSSLMKYDTVFNFEDHFPTLKQLVTPYWGYGASVPGPYDGMSFFLGTVNIAIIVITTIFSVIFWKKINLGSRLLFIWLWISLILSIVFMNYRSTILWKEIPLLPFFQFPWRFLMITTFLAPLYLIILSKIKWFNYVLLLLIPTIIVLNSFQFRPQDFLSRTDNYYINRYIPTPVASPEYMATQEEYLRLPIYTLERPAHNFPLISPEDQIKNITKLNSLNSRIVVDAKDSFILNYYKYFFPGWIAKVDGQEVTIKPEEPYGQISFSVPSGFHLIEVSFGETTPKIFLDLVSGLAIVISFILIFNPFKLIRR